MRTQIAKTEYLPAEYIWGTFLTRTPPPPFPQVHRGGCYREKFIFFLNPLSTRSNYTSIFIFFWFSLDIPCLFFVIFSSYRFRLVSALFILCFDSSTLYLFNSSACYKQTFMLMQSLVYACFGYFKAFWRVFVCFRCSLSSWDKIMRQKA